MFSPLAGWACRQHWAYVEKTGPIEEQAILRFTMKIQCEENVRKSEEISSHFPHYFLTFSTLFPHKNFLTLALEIGRIPHMANVRKNVRKM